jgi:hypothetical protein
VCNKLPRRMFFCSCNLLKLLLLRFILSLYFLFKCLCPPCISCIKCSLHPRLFWPYFMSYRASLPNDCVSLSFSTDGHVSPQQVVHDATFCGMTRTLAPDARMTWTLCLIVRGWHEIWYQISEGCNELLGLVVWGWHEFLNEKLRDDMNCGMTCCANVLYWD